MHDACLGPFVVVSPPRRAIRRGATAGGARPAAAVASGRRGRARTSRGRTTKAFGLACGRRAARRAASSTTASAARSSAATPAPSTTAATIAHQPPCPTTASRPPGCPEREEALERLLDDEDPVEAQRGRRPEPAERAPRPARCATGARARDPPEEQPDGEAEQQDEPRRERVDVAVPLRGQLGVRLLAVRERVAELVHDERDRGQQQEAAPGEGVSESASHAFDRTGARVRLLRRCMGDWLDPAELRVGLGCMRLSTDEDRDEERALATIAAAAAGGDDRVRHGARVRGQRAAARPRAAGVRRARTARIVTKGGMTRAGGGWVPDGRAKAIRADCEASLAALDGLPIDLYLIHAPDPRTPWRTSLRALARLVDEGLVRRVGVANVNRPQLDEAVELAPIAAVQVALSPFDERALRGGVVERCAEVGIALIAHSPLGGPRRAGCSPAASRSRSVAARTARRRPRSRSHGCSGSRRTSSRSRARGVRRRPVRRARRELGARASDERARRGARRARPARAGVGDAEVVLVMGIPGAGKSRVAEDYVARGYVRLNRDERGGSLRDLAEALDEELSAGARRRRARQHVPHARGAELRDRGGRAPRRRGALRLARHAARAGAGQPRRAAARRFGSLPAPEELRQLARREPGVLAPTSQMRALRELEPPSADEGFADVERVPFARAPAAGRAPACSSRPPRSAAGLARRVEHGDRRAAPRLRLAARRRAGRARRRGRAPRRRVSGPVEAAVCPHRGGPPTCWCRPPLPGCSSPSRGRTASTRRARPSSGRAPPTGRWRRRSAPATSRPERLRRRPRPSLRRTRRARTP